MRQPVYKIILMISISLVYGGIENIIHCREFRSDMLEEMSRHLNIAWPGEEGISTVNSGVRDITVRITDGCVEHIGYRIFPDDVRDRFIPPQIADFIERYWLSLSLPMKRLKSVSQQMLEDRFVFSKGGLSTLERLQRDSLLSFSCEIGQGNITVTWGEDPRPVCRITFPKDHELILGRKMPENDRRLASEIRCARIDARADKDNLSPLLSPDTVTSLWVYNEGSYLDCNLKSDRYYRHGDGDSEYIPVFDAGRLPESIANLFTDYDIAEADKIRLVIRQIKFGFEEEMIETTVPEFVAFCKRNGCVPFVGIVSVDDDPAGVADVLVIMRNWNIGYNHLLRVTLPLTCVSTGEGTATARMNAFIPSSNVKNLFKN